MTTLLQMRAQFESLSTQFDQNLNEAAVCAANHDEGNYNHLSVTISLDLKIIQ